MGAEAILAALRVLNQRCVPPLPESDLERIARSTSHYQRPVLLVGSPPLPPPGWPAGRQTGPPPPPAPTNWRALLKAHKQGGLIQDHRNIGLILEFHDYFRGKLWWDDVRNRPMFGQIIIDDDTLVAVARWLGTEEDMSVTSGGFSTVRRCVLSRCRCQRVDILQGWLMQLPAWDGTPRLAMWLSTYAGVAPTAYGMDVSRLLILVMVARILDPGCLCRIVIILEGPEECGKSSLVQALAGEDFYVVLSIGLETKDAHMLLQGVLVAELAELDSLNRTEETRLKAFITMRHDSYIPKYSNFRESYARRAIFVGTTNEESYLKGQTGNTRFLPVKVTKQIDVEGFLLVRDQLFAEALTIYYSGTPWWQMSPEGSAAAHDEREHRRIINVFEDDLDAWLEAERFTLVAYDTANTLVRFTPGETSWPEIARWYLKLQTPAEWKDKNLQMQVTQALKILGWRLIPTRRQGKRLKLWVKTT
jgi:putative DNA primase/helicase